MLWLLGIGALMGVLKNAEDFLPMAFPGIWSKHLETSFASSVSLVPHYGNADKTMFCICRGDSVLDLIMKQRRKQPLALFIVSSFFC